jgi:hypothetical protein
VVDVVDIGFNFNYWLTSCSKFFIGEGTMLRSWLRQAQTGGRVKLINEIQTLPSD